MSERVVVRLGAWGRFSTRSVRAIAAATAALAALTTVVGVGWHNGYPAGKVRLSSGTAWLPSSRVGQLTLLDGSSAEVAAQVQVARPGDRLDTTQHGTTAYVINHTEGSIRRIDSGTLEPTAPVTPIPDAGQGLQVYADAHALYVLDTRHGLLTQIDPTTLISSGGLLPLAARDSAQAALSDTGQLWVLDTTTGDLGWIKEGQRDTRRQAGRPGSGRLVLADGSPVLIDTQARTASTLDPETGDTANTTRLDLRPDDTIQVGGSPHAPRLHAVTSRGVLVVCDLTSTSCGDAVPLGDAGAELGPPIETGDRVFVPDYTGGRVWIVDLKEKRVVAQPTVLSPRVRFQLLTRDGIVFFNDPDSEHAGVIRLDGSVDHVSKYDPEPLVEAGRNPASSAHSQPKPTSAELFPPSTDPSAAALPIPSSGHVSQTAQTPVIADPEAPPASTTSQDGVPTSRPEAPPASPDPTSPAPSAPPKPANFRFTQIRTVPGCSDIHGTGGPGNHSHVVLFVRSYHGGDYYYEKPADFNTAAGTWVAKNVTVGKSDDTGNEFTIFAVGVTEEKARELAKTDNKEHPVKKLPGPELDDLDVTRTGVGNTCP